MLDTIGWMVRQEGVGSLQQCETRANKLGTHVATSDGAGGDGPGRGLTILPFILVQILHVMSRVVDFVKETDEVIKNGVNYGNFETMGTPM